MTTKNPVREEESQLLHECLNLGKGDKLIRFSWNMVCFSIRKIFTLKNMQFTEDDIEDLRNEVFLRLFDKGCRKLRQYEANRGMSLRGWIRMITAQTVLLYIRKKDRSGRLGENNMVFLDPDKIDANIPIPDQAMEDLNKRFDARERLVQVTEKIRKLPYMKRLVLELHFLGGLSFQEIASLTNKKIGNIYAIRCRATEQLKEMMGEA